MQGTLCATGKKKHSRKRLAMRHASHRARRTWGAKGGGLTGSNAALLAGYAAEAVLRMQQRAQQNGA